MQTLSLVLLTAGLSASMLSAQAGPGALNTPTKHPLFNVTELSKISKPAPLYGPTAGSKILIQISATKVGIKGLKPGQWAVALTVRGLSSFYGGNNTLDGVVMGVYDRTQQKPTFTPNTMAKNVIKPGCFGLMLDQKDGKVCTLDWNTGARCAWRKDNASPFGQTVPITAKAGTTAVPSPWIDPAPGYVDSNGDGNATLHLFYANTGSILMREMKLGFDAQGNLNLAQCQAPVISVWTPAQQVAHSPTPVADANGEVQGLYLSARIGNNSDQFWKSNLDSKVPAMLAYGTASTSWYNNGGVAGGELLAAHSRNYTDMESAAFSTMVGSWPKVGGTASLTVRTRNLPNIAPVVSTTVAASLSAAAPFPIPGWNGAYALGAGEIIIASVAALGADETGSFVRKLPNDPRLKGARVYFQGLSNIISATPTMTNTALIIIR